METDKTISVVDDKTGDPSTPADPPASPSAGENEPSKSSPNAERRIGSLTKEKYYWKGRAEAAEAASTASIPAEEPEALDATENLDRMDFDSDAAYLKAMNDKNMDMLRKSLAAEKGKEKALEIQNARQLQVDAARVKYADFDEIALTPTLPISQGMIDAASGENYADILYALGSEPEEANRIYHLSPIQQIKEIGKIESRLKKTKTVVQPSADPPPTIVTGGNPSPGIIAESDMPRGDLHAKWEKERLDKIRSRYGQ